MRRVSLLSGLAVFALLVAPALSSVASAAPPSQYKPHITIGGNVTGGAGGAATVNGTNKGNNIGGDGGSVTIK